MASSLPPIPTPPSQLWREFRIQFLPLVTFACTMVGVLLLWRSYVMPVQVVGLVETNSVAITSTMPGLLTNLFVKPFDEVTNGQVIGIVMTFDPALTEASMKRIEADQRVLQERMQLTEMGRKEMITRLRLDLVEQKLLLGNEKVQLAQAETNRIRQAQLLASNFISEAIFEVAKAQHESLANNVSNRTWMIQLWERDLAQIEPSQTAAAADVEKMIEESIRQQKAELFELQKPIVLTAPIDGTVGRILRVQGERVMDRDPILFISASRSSRVTAYVRQPIAHRPKVGDTVTIRTRTPRRMTAEARIDRVGTQLEPISPFMIPWATSRRVFELGLPISIALPAGFDLLPGELVEVAMIR